VTLWHGETDNWAPIILAEDLAERLPTLAAFHRLPGLSHYGTLAHVLTTIDA
jgi:pimeloyl-ACP methyl ester carboxylesterase